MSESILSLRQDYKERAADCAPTEDGQEPRVIQGAIWYDAGGYPMRETYIEYAQN